MSSLVDAVDALSAAWAPDDEEKREAVSALTCLSITYEDHPASADAVRDGCERLLAALGHAVTSFGNNGQDARVEWEISHVWVAEMMRAYDEIGDALVKVEADAGRLVTP